MIANLTIVPKWYGYDQRAIGEIGENIVNTFGGLLDQFQIKTYQFYPPIDIQRLEDIARELERSIEGYILCLFHYNDTVPGFIPNTPEERTAIIATDTPWTSSKLGCMKFIERCTMVSVHELGHLFGLDEHDTESYTRNGKFCPMYILPGPKIIDMTDTMFCDSCYQKLGI